MKSKQNWPDALVEWYWLHKRTMPWRDNPSPYHVWISEMMLQQTQVSTVIPYFENFINKFPNVLALAKASQEEVLKSWEGLGYYSRARNLHKSAQIVIDKYNGELPSDYDTLQELPGIGPYCAAAIASIAFNKAIPVVDGNVFRVFSRFWDSKLDIVEPKTKKYFFNQLSEPIKKVSPSAFNQGMMELGAVICKKQNPICTKCPLKNECQAFQKKTIHLRPINSKKILQPTVQVAVGIICNKNMVLITKRSESQLLGGLWEFPGGKKKETETLAETLHRELYEELSIAVNIISEYPLIKHAYTHFKIELTAFQCEYKSGNIQLNSATDYKWVTLSELKHYPFPKANHKLFKFIK